MLSYQAGMMKGIPVASGEQGWPMALRARPEQKLSKLSSLATDMRSQLDVSTEGSLHPDSHC
jgi:hypothetical protein